MQNGSEKSKGKCKRYKKCESVAPNWSNNKCVPNWSIGQAELPLRNHSVSSVSHPAEVDNGGFGDLGFN